MVAPRIAGPATQASAPEMPAMHEQQGGSALNQVMVRLNGPDQNSASIRVVDHGGEIRLAVRASDPQLSESLRGNVEQLTSRLNDSGWSAEVWKPTAAAAPSRADAPSQQSSEQRQNSAGQHSPDPDTRDRRNQQQQSPEWAEEFELWQ